MSKLIRAFALAAFALTLSFAVKAEEHKAPHGGTILEVGEEAAHIEYIHDAKAGKITLYILAGDVKTPVALKEAPKLNLKTKDGNKQVELKGKESMWEATDDVLKEAPKGRIVLTLPDGKKYNVDVK